MWHIMGGGRTIFLPCIQGGEEFFVTTAGGGEEIFCRVKNFYAVCREEVLLVGLPELEDMKLTFLVVKLIQWY